MAKAKEDKQEIIADIDATEEVAEVKETEAVEALADVEEAVVEAEEAKEEAKPAKKTAKAGKRSAKAVAEEEAEEAKEAAKEAPAEEAPKKPAKIQVPNPKKRHGKGYREAAAKVDRETRYDLEEAVKLVKVTASTKFDASIELHMNLGVDPRQADQMVRASVTLPAGTGRSLRVAVLAPADKHADAKKAGADIISDGDLLTKIEKGELKFDVLVATPDMMAKLGKVAKVLGPRGLMPNPKSGTVTANVGQAVKEAKAGKVEFRIDKQAIVHLGIGKVSFSDADLTSNLVTAIDAVMKAKPSATKGIYVKSIAIASSMGPGIRLDVQKAIAAANPKR